MPDSDLGDFQRAVRGIRSSATVTRMPPHSPLVRRWADQLWTNLPVAFGHRLELTGTSARLVRVHDDLDARRPARTRNDRVFDRRATPTWPWCS